MSSVGGPKGPRDSSKTDRVEPIRETSKPKPVDNQARQEEPADQDSSQQESSAEDSRIGSTPEAQQMVDDLARRKILRKAGIDPDTGEKLEGQGEQAGPDEGTIQRGTKAYEETMRREKKDKGKGGGEPGTPSGGVSR